jgi:hypothetical protein
MIQRPLLLLLLVLLRPTDAKKAYPVPSALPPHSWDSVGHKLFIHGCKADGLFNNTELVNALFI